MKTCMVILFWMTGLVWAVDAEKCVQIFYDSVPGASPPYTDGRAQASLLENLIAHFPHIQQYVIPVEKYQKNQLSQCAANFYLGSYYDNPVPQEFLEDYIATPNTAVWLGYGFWQLGASALRSLWQVEFTGLSELDWAQPDAKGQPGFYRFFDYRGKTFVKYGAFTNAEGSAFDAAFEIALLKPLVQKHSKTIVWAQHSSLPEKVPYVLQSGPKWLVGEIPFSFVTEGDRYLVFADLLFDMLQEKPRYPGKKPAFLRFEDIHAKVSPWQLNGFLKMTKKMQIPFGISLIPVFADPLSAVTTQPEQKLIRLGDPQARELVAFLEEAQSQGASLIMHGTTHQYGNAKNPYNGVSGADYEFWNVETGSGVQEDSPQWVIERLEDGLSSMAEAGLAPPSLWVTPHYQASTLDYILFAKLFSFSAGRFDYRQPRKIVAGKLPQSLRMDNSGANENGNRLQYLSDTQVVLHEPSTQNGQFFPYEIYGDVFGARVIPENVGFVQPVDGNMGEKVTNVKDLIETVKRNSVLRDVWASFFLHPYLLDTKANGGIAATPGDTRELEELLQTIQNSGYAFIDLKTWVKNHQNIQRPPTIER